MHLTYRKNHGRLVEKKNFVQIILADIEEVESGEVEATRALSMASIRFTESLINCLWKKGILNNEDVQNILKDIENVHQKAEIKIEE